MKGLEMVKCKSLRINMLRITHTGKSVNFPVTTDEDDVRGERIDNHQNSLHQINKEVLKWNYFLIQIKVIDVLALVEICIQSAIVNILLLIKYFIKN